MTRVEQPSLTIVIPIMDRADDLERSLPSMVGQSYESYRVAIVDFGSRDGLTKSLSRWPSQRLDVIRCPRPRYFSFSRARNVGLRYTHSELVFFLNADNEFRDEHHLGEIVASYLAGRGADGSWCARWRAFSGYAPLESAAKAPPVDGGGSRVYAHGLGSALLAERRAVQAIGGFNEFLTDWGYEDTDLLQRLEICGFGRIEIRDLEQRDHPDSWRTANFRFKDRGWTWQRNRWLSDRTIASFGVVPPAPRYPGRVRALELGGVRYPGARAPQQEWVVPRDSLARLRVLLWRYRYRSQ
jgi:glycosyltransferase involved in cell wall biosynthesis